MERISMLTALLLLSKISESLTETLTDPINNSVHKVLVNMEEGEVCRTHDCAVKGKVP